MRSICGLTLLLWGLGATIAVAQPPRAEFGIRELRADQIKPAFSIEPVVQRLNARRGQLLPFKFELTSLARTTTIEARPVAMRQELSGAIQPDTDSPPPSEVTMTSATRFDIAEDAQITIEGNIRVPTSNSPFHTFGILVTDYGRKVDATSPQAAANEPRMTIDFVTRYLLRIDVEVQGVRPTDAGKLLLEAGEVREYQGFPQARVTIVNPTESPLEFELECRLVSPSDPNLSKSFPLMMPIRASMPPPDRFEARILPGARIRMEELIPTTVFPGAYELEASVTAGRRKWNTVRFPFLIEDDAFPGQSALVAQVAPGVSLSPAQIELSTLRGGARFVAVTINNASPEATDFNLQTVGLDAQPAAWFAVRPDVFRLEPGGSRKVLVTLGNDRPTTADAYGHLVVQSTSASGAASGETSALTIVSVVEPTPPQLQLGQLAWRVDGAIPAIVVPVTNAGSRFVPLDGKLLLTNIDSGTRHEFTGGYGRWLLPGEGRDLAFRINDRVPGGKYELKILVRQGEDQPTVELKTIVELSEGG